jgi:hypothetical protein
MPLPCPCSLVHKKHAHLSITPQYLLNKTLCLNYNDTRYSYNVTCFHRGIFYTPYTHFLFPWKQTKPVYVAFHYFLKLPIKYFFNYLTHKASLSYSHYLITWWKLQLKLSIIWPIFLCVNRIKTVHRRTWLSEPDHCRRKKQTITLSKDGKRCLLKIYRIRTKEIESNFLASLISKAMVNLKRVLAFGFPLTKNSILDRI